MRVLNDLALAYKSRIALYEGTWQNYHKVKADPIYTNGINDEKIRQLLEQTRDAALEVMDSGRWRIYSAVKPEEDYRALFITTDLSTNPEILLYRRYNVPPVEITINQSN